MQRYLTAPTSLIISVLRGGAKTRHSGVELLRIIAMILVMIVHADFFSLGIPTIENLYNAPVPTVTRFLIQSLSICCVNVFVLISGYFGIRPKLKGLVSFVYQILFFFCLIYVVCIIIGISGIRPYGFLQCLCLTPANWFVKAYLLLYIISPVLNSFVDMQNRTLHKHVLIGFYIIQTIYGCMFAASFFENGYGTLSFIGLYLLGRYINIYHPTFSNLRLRYDLAIYFICAGVITLLAVGLLKIGKNPDYILYTYINPLVIIESLALILSFTKLSFKSKITNWIASSAFAVYLLHANPNLLKEFYAGTIKLIYDATSGVLTLIYIGVFIFLVFVSSIIIDQFRKISYEFFLKEIRNWRMESRHL